MLKEFKLVGNVLEACSRAGEFKAVNVSFHNSSLAAAFPPRSYKASYKIFDEEDKNVYNLTYYASLVH